MLAQADRDVSIIPKHEFLEFFFFAGGTSGFTRQVRSVRLIDVTSSPLTISDSDGDVIRTGPHSETPHLFPPLVRARRSHY